MLFFLIALLLPSVADGKAYCFGATADAIRDIVGLLAIYQDVVQVEWEAHLLGAPLAVA